MLFRFINFINIKKHYSDKNSMYIQMKNKHVETTRHQQCTDTGI